MCTYESFIIKKDNYNQLMATLEKEFLFLTKYTLETMSPDCNYRLSIIKENETIVGSCLYSIDPELEIYIEQIEISEKYRKKGYAEKLLNQIILETNAMSLEGIIASNYSAFCFWEKIANENQSELEVPEKYLPYLNKDDYNFSIEFYFTLV